MKKFISVLLCLAVIITAASFASCSGGDSQGKKIAGIDDLAGAKIGVQLGTTGDIYASDYEEQGSSIERFNKGADAVLALTQGKVDCVIIDREPAKAFVEANKGLKILDEPFAGIDPKAVYEIKQIVKHLANSGIGILLTDHNVRDTLEITTTAHIISNGEILVSGTRDEVLDNDTAREIYFGRDFDE